MFMRAFDPDDDELLVPSAAELIEAPRLAECRVLIPEEIVSVKKVKHRKRRFTVIRDTYV